MANILNKDHWQTFSLDMTTHGFEQFSSQLNILNQNEPQVYVHVCDEWPLKNKVLRIGKAESGVYERWINSKNGHLNTFLWAVGESEKYGHKNARDYPKYLLFFASLFELKTKLCVLTCQPDAKGKGAAIASEKALISQFSPMWESFKKYEKLGKNYAVLSGKDLDEEIHASVTELGGAYTAISRQRGGDKIFSKPVPDLIDFGANIGGSIEDCNIKNTTFQST